MSKSFISRNDEGLLVYFPIVLMGSNAIDVEELVGGEEKGMLPVLSSSSIKNSSK